MAQYLNGVFAMFFSAADGNRLVQMWGWFAANHFYGGDLFCGTNNGDDPACSSSDDLILSSPEVKIRSFAEELLVPPLASY